MSPQDEDRYIADCAARRRRGEKPSSRFFEEVSSNGGGTMKAKLTMDSADRKERAQEAADYEALCRGDKFWWRDPPKTAGFEEVSSNGGGTMSAKLGLGMKSLAQWEREHGMSSTGGGGTMRAKLTTDSAARKGSPVATGFLDYFPLAIAEVARLSAASNEKHNPGEPLHWSREKSSDHADCLVRHQMERGTLDTDGFLHDAKVAWRALAQLQIALERAKGS